MKTSLSAPLLISNTEVSLFMTNRQLNNWVYYAFSLCFFHASLMSFVSLKKKNTMHASSVLLGLMTLFCGKTCIFQCDIIQICLQRFSDYKLWTQLIYDISSFSLKFSETLANSQAQRNVCGTDEQQGLSLCYFAAQYFKRRYVS